MTDQERFNRKMSAIPDEDLIKKVDTWTDRLCTSNGQAWMLTVPPSINDPDVLFHEPMKRYERLKAENQRLRNALEDILGEATFADKCDVQLVYELAEEALQQEGENK